jgi:hypothetical protein
VVPPCSANELGIGILKTTPGAGLFVVSIDVELAWGQVHHGAGTRPNTLFDQERQSVAALLELMERHEISATWAVVGHLFLDECKPVDGWQHPEVKRADYPWFSGDWFGEDPGTSMEEDPRWYGRDLIEAIESCPVPQEIGSHSFSHQIIGDVACDADVFRSELSASRRAADALGVDLQSFVYPRNSIAYGEVLTEQGFAAYRGKTPPRFPGRSALVRRALALADSISPMRATAVRPSLHEGLCNVPQTYLFDPDSGLAVLLGRRLWPKLISRRVDQAARHGSLFHLWFHSHDIAKAPERALSSLDQVFRVVNRERRAGRLVNMTMGQVAEAMNDELSEARDDSP